MQIAWCDFSYVYVCCLGIFFPSSILFIYLCIYAIFSDSLSHTAMWSSFVSKQGRHIHGFLIEEVLLHQLVFINPLNTCISVWWIAAFEIQERYFSINLSSRTRYHDIDLFWSIVWLFRSWRIESFHIAKIIWNIWPLHNMIWLKHRNEICLTLHSITHH